jgi:hypothetical protein
VLGMAIAIRSAALLAGSLVAGYAFVRHGRRSLRPSFVYFAVALMAAFLCGRSCGGHRQSGSIEFGRAVPDTRVLFVG